MRLRRPLPQRGVPLIVFFLLVGTSFLFSADAVSAADPQFLNLPSNFTIYEDARFEFFVQGNDSDGDYPLNFSTPGSLFVLLTVMFQVFWSDAL